MTKKDRTRLGRSLVAGLTAALIALSGTSFAQSATEWTFFTYFSVNDKPTNLNRDFAEDVEKATDGRLKITVLAAGELPYKAPDVVRVVASNQVEMGDVAVGFASGDVPELNVLSMPFLCTSFESFDNVIPEITPIVAEVMKSEFGLEVGVQWTMPPQNLWLNRQVSSISDLKGLKVRTWNPQQVEMIRSLGGSPVSITSGEVIPALERKTIDGAITSALSANDWRAYDTLETGYMVNMTMGHQMMLVNGEAMAELPDDVREVLLAKIEEWAPKYGEMSRAGDVAARENLQANGITLIDPKADDMAIARDAMEPLWQEWAAKNGDVAKQLLGIASNACVGS